MNHECSLWKFGELKVIESDPFIQIVTSTHSELKIHPYHPFEDMTLIDKVKDFGISTYRKYLFDTLTTEIQVESLNILVFTRYDLMVYSKEFLLLYQFKSSDFGNDDDYFVSIKWVTQSKILVLSNNGLSLRSLESPRVNQ